MRVFTFLKVLVFLFLLVAAIAYLKPYLLRSSVVASVIPTTSSSPGSANPGSLQIHYSPEENLEAIDVAYLREARSSIEMYAFSLTDEAIIAELKAAGLRGVTVSLYLDNEQTEDELRRPRLRALLLDLASTPNVTIRVKHSRILAHTKAYVVDRGILREGSANFSPSALKEQDNDLLLTNNAGAIRSFGAAFEQSWTRPEDVGLAQFAQQF